MTTTPDLDVLVVGGGLAGLAAGATATAAGARTLVLDAHTPGGRARTTERDGFIFNMGAHALYRGGPGMAVLTALGLSPQGSPPPLDQYMLRRDGADTVLPFGPGSLLRTHALGARSKAKIGALLARLPKIDAGALAGTSAATWIADQDLRDDAVAVVSALLRIGTYSSDFATLGADAAIGQVQAAVRAGVLYLHGGWAQLIDGLAARTEVRGSAPVSAIEPAAGRFEVVAGDHRYVVGTVVVAAGTPPAARALLPDDPGWGDLGDPVTAACLDAGVRRVPSPGYVLGGDEPLYATTQSPPGRQAPAGKAVVSVLRYGARSAVEDRPDLERYLAAAGVREGDVETSRFLARLVVTGAAPLAGRGGLAGRPRVEQSGTPGVFIAGDWIGRRGMLADASLASGHDAAGAALRYLHAGAPAVTMTP